MYTVSCINVKPIVLAQTAYRFHVVSVIMCDKHVVDIIQVQSVVLKVLLQGAYSHAGIYDKSIGFSVKIIAVSTTTTAE